jgi:hypothetical protein
MKTSIIILSLLAVIVTAFAVMAYVVNREDSVRMEIAAQNGLIQCKEHNYVLWKKECEK